MSVLVWVNHELDSSDDTLNLLAFSNSIEDLFNNLINNFLALSSNRHNYINKSMLDLLIINIDSLRSRFHDCMHDLLDENYSRILLRYRFRCFFNMLEFFTSLSEHLFLFLSNSFPFSRFLRRNLLLAALDFIPAASSAPSLSLLGLELSGPDVTTLTLDLNHNLLCLCTYYLAGPLLEICSGLNSLDYLNAVVADHMTLNMLELPETNMATFTCLLDSDPLLASLHIPLSGNCNFRSHDLLFYSHVENFSIAELHSFWFRGTSITDFNGASCSIFFRFIGSTPLEFNLFACELRIFIENFIENSIYFRLSWFLLYCHFCFCFLTWIISFLVPINPILTDYSGLNLRNCLDSLFSLVSLLANGMALMLMVKGGLVVNLLLLCPTLLLLVLGVDGHLGVDNLLCADSLHFVVRKVKF